MFRADNKLHQSLGNRGWEPQRFRIHLRGPALGNGQSLVLSSFYCLFLAGSLAEALVFLIGMRLCVTVVFRLNKCPAQNQMRAKATQLFLEGILYQAIKWVEKPGT